MGSPGLMPFGLESEQRTVEEMGPVSRQVGRWLISIPRAARVSDQLRRGKRGGARLRQSDRARPFDSLPGKLDGESQGLWSDRSIPNHRTKAMPRPQFDCLSLRDALLQVAEQRQEAEPDCSGAKSSLVLLESLPNCATPFDLPGD